MGLHLGGLITGGFFFGLHLGSYMTGCACNHDFTVCGVELKAIAVCLITLLP